MNFPFINIFVYIMLPWTQIADGHLDRSQMASGRLLRPVIHNLKMSKFVIQGFA